MNFQIDFNGKTEAVNQEACEILFYRAEEMVGHTFISLLDDASMSKWSGYWKKLLEKRLESISLDITFKTKKGLLIPSACYINRLQGKVDGEESLIITVVKHSKKQVELEDYLIDKEINIKKSVNKNLSKNSSLSKKQKVKLNSEDIKKIREARNFLLNNLDKQLPPLRELALEFGTNTFKLKYGFKELYGISVFRFLRNERMRKAKILVQGSNRSFKTIAYLCGFKSVPTFTNTFKSEFGHTPTELRKKFSSENS